MTTGEGFWTQPGAEARIAVSDTNLALDAATDLEVNTLDEHAMIATLPQGEVYLDLRDVAAGETYTIVTPRGAATMAAAGQYAIAAGDGGTPTRVVVLQGTATLGEGPSGSLAAGQQAEIVGAGAPFETRTEPAAHDPFIDHLLAAQHPARRPAAPPPPLVAQMPGGAELADYGSWTPNPQYGEVWYPDVPTGWVPYREGHWAYIAPWGWTWIDSNSWGFAPFHYGRWAEVNGRWGWIPADPVVLPEAPPYPVYAPALVTFFGVGAAVGVGAALLAGGSIGWVPLAPGEIYRPWFRAGRRYERDVNIRHVTNVNEITNVFNRSTVVNNVTVNRFGNAGAATVVPAAAMATSRPLGTVARPASHEMLATARPVYGRAPIPPTTATAGITPAVARAVHAVPPPAGAPPRTPPAPGPVIRAQNLAPRAPAGTVPLAGRPTPPAPGAAEPGRAAAPGPALPHVATPATAGIPHPPLAQLPQVPHPAAPIPHGPTRAAIANPGSPTPPAVPHPTLPVSPTPQVATRQVHPQPAVPRAAPAAVVHPAPVPVPHPAPQAAVVHPAPAPAPRPAPRPAPPPAAAFHPAPPPAAVFHPAPPPAFHPPAPTPHPAPAPAPHAAAPQHQERRPGQP